VRRLGCREKYEQNRRESGTKYAAGQTFSRHGFPPAFLALSPKHGTGKRTPSKNRNRRYGVNRQMPPRPNMAANFFSADLSQIDAWIDAFRTKGIL
jgi:hypothetical protein